MGCVLLLADGVVLKVIDFKYHVVSIVAVFLALAVGIVLGTNVLSGDVLKNLKTQTSDLRKQAQDLRTQNQQQQDQLSGNEAFLAGLEPMAVAGRLAGHRIVVLSTPDAPKGVRENAVKTLVDAGAIVTAQVDIDASYDDPQEATTLDALVKSLGTPAFDPLPAGDVSARASAMLAAALVAGPDAPTTAPVLSSAPPASAPASPPSSESTADVKSKAGETSSGAAKSPNSTTSPDAPVKSYLPLAGSPPPTIPPSFVGGVALDGSSIAVLAGLAKAGFLKLDHQPSVYADMAVVVSGAAPTKSPTPSPSPTTSSLDLIAALARAGSQAVVVGPTGSADSGGLVAQLRGDSSLSKLVSGIDDADSERGLISMVLALTGQISGVVGQYGTGQGAQGPLPTGTPSPATSTAP